MTYGACSKNALAYTTVMTLLDRLRNADAPPAGSPADRFFTDPRSVVIRCGIARSSNCSRFDGSADALLV
jgi:hypothetical protein